MVDTALIYSGIAVTLAGVAAVFLCGIGYIVYQLAQDRLDLKAGVPLPEQERAAAPAAAPAEVQAHAAGAQRRAGAPQPRAWPAPGRPGAGPRSRPAPASPGGRAV